MKRGRIDQTEDTLADGPTDKSRRLEKLAQLKRSREHLERGDAIKALKCARELLIREPEDTEGYVQAARALRASGYDTQAKQALSKAESLATEEAEIKAIRELRFQWSGARIQILPRELLHHIFDHFDTFAIARLQRVCKDWRHAVRSLPRLWTRLVFEKLPKERQTRACRRQLETIAALSGHRYDELSVYDNNPKHRKSFLKHVLPQVDCSHLTKLCLSNDESLWPEEMKEAVSRLLSSCHLKCITLGFSAKSPAALHLDKGLHSSFSKAEQISIRLPDYDIRPYNMLWHILKAAEGTIERFEWWQGPNKALSAPEGTVPTINAPALHTLVIAVKQTLVRPTLATAPLIIAPVQTLRLDEGALYAMARSMPYLMTPALECLEVSLGEMTSRLAESLLQCTSLSQLVLRGTVTTESGLAVFMDALAKASAVPVQDIHLFAMQDRDGPSLTRLVKSRAQGSRPILSVQVVGDLGFREAEYIRSKVPKVSISCHR